MLPARPSLRSEPPCRQRRPGGACGCYSLAAVSSGPCAPLRPPRASTRCPAPRRPHARTPAPLLSVCALGGCWWDVPLHVPPLASCAARPPRIPAPLALPSAPRTRPDRAPGGGASAGLQLPSASRASEGVAYSIACRPPLLKTQPSITLPPSPHRSPRPHTRDIAEGGGGRRGEVGKAE